METSAQTPTEHAAEIDRCNQRGGRMLSIADLLEAHTFSPDLAAHCLALIAQGASFMTAASPGGAGKTTIMGALLNFIPTSVSLTQADSLTAIETGLHHPLPRRCFICHEISPGPYYAYLWGSVLQHYFNLPAAGHLIATNLHADTLEEARDQICGDNGIPETGFRAVNLILFIHQRRIREVWTGNGRDAHVCAFKKDQLISAAWPVKPDSLQTAQKWLSDIARQNIRTLVAIRNLILSASPVQPGV